MVQTETAEMDELRQPGRDGAALLHVAAAAHRCGTTAPGRSQLEAEVCRRSGADRAAPGGS
jgi:hypothetical protein